MKSILGIAFLTALTSNVMAQDKPTVINLCTGAKGQPYEQAGRMIAEFTKNNRYIRINVIADTGGTIGNIDRTTKLDVNNPEACHAFIGQPDGLAFLAVRDRANFNNLKPVAELHREYLHVVCSRESGLKRLQDLADDPTKYKVALGNENSGAWLVWQNFTRHYKKLGEVPTTPETGVIALAAVASNNTTCTLIPVGIGSPVMTSANENFGDKVVLIKATASEFDSAKTHDGKRLYTFSDIPGGTYKNIQKGFFSSSVETVSWNAILYVNSDRVNETALIEIINAAVKARPGIQATFGK